VELSAAIERVLGGLFEARTGQQLSSDRRWRMETALQPILRARALPSADALVSLLLSGRDARIADEIVEGLLNNETSFFRDPQAFRVVERAITERLQADPGRRLRIWCAGCSTGQEAYSLAMAMVERVRPRVLPEIVATDISAGVIERAKIGRYSHFEIQRGLPMQSMIRWFDPEGDDWRAKPILREMVSFQRRGLGEGPPSRIAFDIVLCRNVMLYFTGQFRRQVFDMIAGAIAEDGYLLLGAGETVIGQTGRFAPDPDFRGLYRLVGEAGLRNRGGRP
jgi:chemotaxis protein methyltransferase CheR